MHDRGSQRIRSFRHTNLAFPEQQRLHHRIRQPPLHQQLGKPKRRRIISEHIRRKGLAIEDNGNILRRLEPHIRPLRASLQKRNRRNQKAHLPVIRLQEQSIGPRRHPVIGHNALYVYPCLRRKPFRLDRPGELNQPCIHLGRVFLVQIRLIFRSGRADFRRNLLPVSQSKICQRPNNLRSHHSNDSNKNRRPAPTHQSGNAFHFNKRH